MVLGRAGVLSSPDCADSAHVFAILGYQVLGTTGIIERVVIRERGGWSRTGAFQVGLGVLLGIWLTLLALLSVVGLPEGPLPMLLLFGPLILLVLFGPLLLNDAVTRLAS